MMMIRILALTALATLLTGCWDTGTGEKVGQIIKLNKQGVFCQTYEAELIRGGLNNGSGASSTIFDFTIEDTALVPQIQEALDKQYEVKIHYRMENVTLCRSDSDNHFLTGIERMNQQGHPMEVAPAEDPREAKRRELQRQLDEMNRDDGVVRHP